MLFLFLRAASRIWRASSREPASGFSQATFLPASRAAMAISAWALLGLVTSTRSISGFLTARSQLVSEFLQPQRFLKDSSSSGFRPTTVCMMGLRGSVKNLSTFRNALLWARPMNLLPMRQMFVTSFAMILLLEFLSGVGVYPAAMAMQSHQVAGLGGHPMALFAHPFDVAADGVGDGHARLAAGEKIIEGIAQFVSGFLAGIARVVIHSAGVAELSVLVEDVIVRGAEGAVGEGYFLGVIADIGEAVVLVFG